MQAPGDHQVNDDPQIIVQPDGDAFADPPELPHHLSLHLGDRRLRGAKNKGARDPHLLECPADDSLVERAQIGIDIGEFGHLRTVADAIQRGDRIATLRRAGTHPNAGMWDTRLSGEGVD